MGWPIGVAVFLVVLASTALVTAHVLHYMPVTDDEHAYQFQAQLLASGRLFADSAPGTGARFLRQSIHRQ